MNQRQIAFLAAAKTMAAGLHNRMFADMYLTSVTRMLAGDANLFQFIKGLERTPVGIEEFLDSGEFLGATDMVLWPEVRKAIIELNRDWWKGPTGGAYDSATLMGATGTGKCLAKGTPVILYDGRVKPVEAIKIGDQLMGPDSTPRTVLSLAHGREEMYRVTPKRGDAYTVNESHILSLKITGLGMTRHGNPKQVTGGDGISYGSGDIADISILDYLKSTSTFKHVAKGWRPGAISFPPQEVYVDPYFIGLWLGDGSSHAPNITTNDREIASYVFGLAAGLGLRVRESSVAGRCPTYCIVNSRGRGNGLRDEMHSLGLFGGKRIPGSYLRNCEEVRWAVLAGLIDSDGHKNVKNSCSGFEITTKHKLLRDDILYLARSLGLSATSKEEFKSCQTGAGGHYQRIYICGEMEQMPVLLERKRPGHGSTMDVRLTGITVEPVGEGDYYGFEIDGDRRFLLGDFTVTHNTSVAILTIIYHLYLLSCIVNPQGLYGFPKATSIVFPIMGAKPRVVSKVIYLPMRKLIETMPYFQKHMLFDKTIESEMFFKEKNIRIAQAGGDEDAILGEAVIGGIIDEINFMNVVLRSKKAEVTSGRAGLYDQAQQVHSTMTRRKRGRFTRPGPMIGVVIASSSTRYKGDFTDSDRKFVEKNGIKTRYIYNKRQYEVVPAERFSGKKFRLVIGNDIHHDTRVLEDGEVMPDGAWVEELPIEYRDDFLTKPHDSLRDVMGISNNALSPFIKSRHKVYECVEAGREMGLESFLTKDHVILGEDGMPKVKDGTYCANPSRPRYVHIDLSRNADRCIAEGQRVLLADRTYREIQNLVVGDEVVTHTGSTMPVTAVHSNGVKPVLSVEIYGYYATLRATDNHMVWAVRRSRVSYANGRLVKPSDGKFTKRSGKTARARYSYVPEFVELGTLVPGDFLVTPRLQTVECSTIENTPLTYEAGYIAGLFAAEGSFWVDRKTEYVQFSLHKNETLIASQLAAYLASEFGVTTRTCSSKDSQAITYRTSKSERLVQFLLATVGEYSDRKHFSGSGFGNKQFIAGMCQSYVDGDGHVRYDANGDAINFKVKTVSRAMGEAFYWALISRGFVATIWYDEAYTSVINGVSVSHKASYHISLSGKEQMRKFRFWSDQVSDVPCSQTLNLEEYMLSPIQSINDGGTAKVYDITVANDSSYVVGNSVVHNCGIAMLRFDGMKRVARSTKDKDGQPLSELLPIAVVEMACSIQPDANNEIDVAEVRMFVKYLRTRYGFPIKGVSYDGVDSRESIQAWRKGGLRASMVSVDRLSAPYKQFRDALYDTRVILQEDGTSLAEILELEYDEDKDKIDHPVNGSKDVSDSICGAYTNMLERKSTWTAAAADDVAFELAGRASYDERFDAPRPV